MTEYPVTISLIIVTAVLSFLCFSNDALRNKLIFHPPSIIKYKQWYRFISSGFIHADTQHLIFNMISLYFFGRSWESIHLQQMGYAPFIYVLFYLGTMILADLPSFIKNKNNWYYRSLGASGAVSAIIFSVILYNPWGLIYVMFLPLPSIIYAVAFVGISIYLERQGEGRINHSAHLFGALAGILGTVLLNPSVIPYFIEALRHPTF